MNFLADESCAGPVIAALREAGHDVVAIAEVAKGVTDEQVLERALNEKRVLITEDRDFGEFPVRWPTHGDFGCRICTSSARERFSLGIRAPR